MDEISVLFALEAEELINENKLDEAVKLCEAGLKIYPDYASAVAILAHAYLLRGDSEKAENIIEKYSDKIIHTNIPRIKTNKQKETEQSVGTDSFRDIIYDLQNASEISMHSFFVLSDKFSDEPNYAINTDTAPKLMTDFYNYPANPKTISKYKYNLKKTITLEPDEYYQIEDISGLPITEIFADILIKQGNYGKAIQILNRLLLNEPQKAEYYEAKIEETLKERENQLLIFGNNETL